MAAIKVIAALAILLFFVVSVQITVTTKQHEKILKSESEEK